MTYAIIETGGKQLRVEPGRFYDIELLHVEADAEVTIDKVLFVNNDGDVSIGQPLVAGATVTGTVMRHFRGRKVLVYKMKPKKKTRKKRGHRQEITRLMIDSISLNGTVLGGKKEESTPVTAEVASAPVEEAAPAIAEVVTTTAEEAAPATTEAAE
ncbi:50S ribosomal protein L21 [Aerosakkonemataceae cyanobacterium BLCC-F50]|uniref:Large ribosomal subunit protein bL21 n=1 Tax=Floridaenema flaviceps BLCC-F50 TaxID=3153642 RepID=A0ABV4XNB2_9CYAN